MEHFPAYGLPLDTVRYVNNESGASLRVGQVLYLPTPLRNVVNLSSADRDLFERLVSAESKGEPGKGQAAVASVVLNRVSSPDFPNTVRGVIMQYSGSMPASLRWRTGRSTSPKSVITYALRKQNRNATAKRGAHPAGACAS